MPFSRRIPHRRPRSAGPCIRVSACALGRAWFRPQAPSWRAPDGSGTPLFSTRGSRPRQPRPASPSPKRKAPKSRRPRSSSAFRSPIAPAPPGALRRACRFRRVAPCAAPGSFYCARPPSRRFAFFGRSRPSSVRSPPSIVRSLHLCLACSLFPIDSHFCKNARDFSGHLFFAFRCQFFSARFFSRTDCPRRLSDARRLRLRGVIRNAAQAGARAFPRYP